MVDTAPIRAFLDDKHVTLAERVSEFASRQLAPLAEPKDDAAARLQARELLGTLGAAGWLQPIRDLRNSRRQIRSQRLYRIAIHHRSGSSVR